MFWSYQSESWVFSKWSGLLFVVNLRLHVIDWRVAVPPIGLADTADSCPVPLSGRYLHSTFLSPYSPLCLLANSYSSLRAPGTCHLCLQTEFILFLYNLGRLSILMTTLIKCYNDLLWNLSFPVKDRVWRSRCLIHLLISSAKHKAWHGVEN